MNSSVRELLSDNMRLLRRFRDMSQADLAEAAEVTPGYIGAIEMGRKLPSFDVLQRIASALDVRVYRLFQSEDDILQTQGLEPLQEIHKTVEKSIRDVLDKTFADFLKRC